MKTARNIFQLAFASTILTCSCSTFAATATVQVGSGGNFFVPALTNIAINDSVIWTWAGNFHSTTSTNALWDSGVNNSPHSFTNQFTTNGAFFYYCTIHGTPTSGMKGEIIVTSPDMPPTISITNPPDGASLIPPASFTLTATAQGVNVTNVQFLNGTISLGNVTASPYSIPVNNLGAGDYTFSAIVADNDGLTATNSISAHVITPSPIVLGSPQFISPNGFQFTYSANISLNYVVQRSSDLSNWMSLDTNRAGANPVTFTDTNAVASPEFYRAGVQPNP